MSGNRFIRVLQALADLTDRPTRWLRRLDLRFSKSRATSGSLGQFFSSFNRRVFLLFVWLTSLVDLPLKWFRQIRPSRRVQPEKLSLMARAEGTMGRFLLGVLWVLRFPSERIDRWFGKTKKIVVADPKLEEEELKRQLQRSIAAKRHRDKLAKSLPGRIGRYVIIPATGFVNFAFAYARTRTLALVGWGVPVTLATALLFSVYFQVSFFDNSRLAGRYELALAEAVKAGRTEEADRFRLKLEQLGFRTDRGNFRTAMALAETGDFRGAYELMLEIAPPTRPGFPSAHLWIVENLLDGKLDMPSSQALELALLHIAQLRTRVGEADQLLFLEGLTNFRMGRLDRAQRSLESVRGDVSPASALLLELYYQQQNITALKKTAVTLSRQLQQRVNEGKELTNEEQIWLTAAHLALGDESVANAAVEDWYRANPASPAAMRRQATLELRQVDIWLKNPEQMPIEEVRSKLTSIATTLPEDDRLLVLDRLSSIARQSKRNVQIAGLFESLLQESEFPAFAVAHLGSLSAELGRWDDAERLLLRATEVDPKLANAWNNLAFVLNSTSSPRRPFALKYAEQAIALDPDNPLFRQTRGTVYFNLRRWDQAIADLEIAINGNRDLPRIHQMLAECYRQVGNVELAELYQNATRQ
ncbi:MAG: tetratricopeptide repeat protein [Planctomycetaceae bacterium]|nr:tetratricopeptide repeat protein [Planctomycetaceae bacterium]